MKQPNLIMLLAIVFFLLFPLRAQAQHTYSYSSIDYDESTSLISAYAQTSPDYNTQGFYGYPSVTTKVTDGSGVELATQRSQTGSVSFTVVGDGSDSYKISSGHYMIASYREYNAYSQCNGRYYSFGFVDYYNYQHFTETPSTPNIYFSYDYFGPGPNCPEESAAYIFGGTTATVRRPTLNGLSDIWWFNGMTPAFYPLTSTLNASPSDRSSYTFKIVSGTDKAGLGSSNAATYYSSANSVDLNSTSFSRSAADVSATVTVGHWTSVPFNLSIHTAYVLGQAGAPSTVSDSTYGYSTTIPYSIYDQYGNLLPFDLTVNEFFPSGWPNDDPYSNWVHGPAGGSPTLNATFHDRITGNSGNPTPPSTGPCQPLCDHKIHHAFQEWRAGSLTPGQGFRMQTDTLQRYTDHATHEQIVSPAP